MFAIGAIHVREGDAGLLNATSANSSAIDIATAILEKIYLENIPRLKRRKIAIQVALTLLVLLILSTLWVMIYWY